MGGTISGQAGESEQGAAGCFGKLPSVPTLAPNFSAGDSSSMSKNSVMREQGVQSDVRDSPLQGGLNVTASSRRVSSSAKELESISNRLEARGMPNDRFILMNPRELHDRDPAARQLWERSKQWEPSATRPKPVYPRPSIEEDKPSNKKNSPDSTPEKVTSDDDSTSYQVTPSANSQLESPDTYQIESNLFIPIRDSDDESSGGVNSRAPAKPAGSISPIPKIKLKPRGQQFDLSINRLGF